MAKALPQGETLKGHIGPANFDGEGMKRVVHQAVYQAGTRAKGDEAIAEALRRAGAEVIPLSAAYLTAFVLGPLYDAVCELIAPEAAERVVSILKPVLKKKTELEMGEAPRSEPRIPTVLIVDDDIVVRAQLLSILSGSGYTAVSAPDSNVALAMSVRCRPDLIISALKMGTARGGQLAALLRVAFHEDAPPIIILTDEDIPCDHSHGVCMIAKPIERASLLAAVGPLMRRSEVPPHGKRTSA